MIIMLFIDSKAPNSQPLAQIVINTPSTTPKMVITAYKLIKIFYVENTKIIKAKDRLIIIPYIAPSIKASSDTIHNQLSDY